jgi:hypothetical protein
VLRPGGVLALWSAAESGQLADDLAAVFGAVTPIPMEVRLQGRAEGYWVYLARLR